MSLISLTCEYWIAEHGTDETNTHAVRRSSGSRKWHLCSTNSNTRNSSYRLSFYFWNTMTAKRHQACAFCAGQLGQIAKHCYMIQFSVFLYRWPTLFPHQLLRATSC